MFWSSLTGYLPCWQCNLSFLGIWVQYTNFFSADIKQVYRHKISLVLPSALMSQLRTLTTWPKHRVLIYRVRQTAYFHCNQPLKNELPHPFNGPTLCSCGCLIQRKIGGCLWLLSFSSCSYFLLGGNRYDYGTQNTRAPE